MSKGRGQELRRPRCRGVSRHDGHVVNVRWQRQLWEVGPKAANLGLHRQGKQKRPQRVAFLHALPRLYTGGERFLLLGPVLQRRRATRPVQGQDARQQMRHAFCD